jgi:phosphoglycerate kinase
MKRLLTLEDLDLSKLAGRRVLVRVDYNVPMKDGAVMDATRLEESLPTLRELIAAGARVLLASHCGRPKGEPNPKYTLRPVAARLAELLGRPVAFCRRLRRRARRARRRRPCERRRLPARELAVPRR